MAQKLVIINYDTVATALSMACHMHVVLMTWAWHLSVHLSLCL